MKLLKMLAIYDVYDDDRDLWDKKQYMHIYILPDDHPDMLSDEEKEMYAKKILDKWGFYPKSVYRFNMVDKSRIEYAFANLNNCNSDNELRWTDAYSDPIPLYNTYKRYYVEDEYNYSESGCIFNKNDLYSYLNKKYGKENWLPTGEVKKANFDDYVVGFKYVEFYKILTEDPYEIRVYST